jgi:hypothetical protein
MWRPLLSQDAELVSGADLAVTILPMNSPRVPLENGPGLSPLDRGLRLPAGLGGHSREPRLDSFQNRKFHEQRQPEHRIRQRLKVAEVCRQRRRCYRDRGDDGGCKHDPTSPAILHGGAARHLRFCGQVVQAVRSLAHFLRELA